MFCMQTTNLLLISSLDLSLAYANIYIVHSAWLTAHLLVSHLSGLITLAISFGVLDFTSFAIDHLLM